MSKKHLIPFAVAILLSSCAYNIEEQSTAHSETKINQKEIAATKLDITLKNDKLLNQDAMVLGIICSAHKYKMKTTDALENRLKEIDKDTLLGNTPTPDIHVTTNYSNGTVKCVMNSAMSGKCQATVDLSGKIVPKLGKEKPFSITKKSVLPTVGCEGAANSLRQASSDVVSELISIIRSYDKK